ncbi:MAG: FliG C-terminal domain-containing protein, partial [Planctomycetota bacterium JB042]
MTTGADKVATFLLTLDRPVAADLLRLLPEVDRHQVTKALIKLGDTFLGNETRTSLLSEFQETLAGRPGDTPSPEEIKGLLEEAFGADAMSLTNRFESRDVRSQASFVLRRLEPAALAFVLADEHPQAIAVILLELGADVASAVLPLFDRETQQELVERMVNMKRVAPELVAAMIRAVTDRARTLASAEGDEDEEGSGGSDQLKTVATMLNRFEEADQRELLASIEANDPDKAQAVKDQLFTFDDLLKLGVRDVQRILSGIDTRVLATSLKSASSELTEFLLGNVSKRVRERVEEERETLGALRLSEVKQAQNEMAAGARR